MINIMYLIMIIIAWLSAANSFSLCRNRLGFAKACALQETNDDSIYGAEFLFNKGQKRKKILKNELTDLDINTKYAIKEKAKQSFNSVRISFLLDSAFFSMIGLCGFWYFGSFKDSYSYLVGAFLGLLYAGLLGNYVETLGSQEGSRGGSLRYLPVIVLILLYGKYRSTFSIIPEIVGFFSYQIGSLFQIFNEGLYDDEEGNNNN